MLYFLVLQFFFYSQLCSTLGEDRIYYIAAEERYWDYAPTGVNALNGKNLNSDEDAQIYVKEGVNRIGKVYKKALFREYTDDSYTTEAPRAAFLGVLGPILRAEVGDRVIIHFKNKAHKRKYSMHPHGVFYTKEHEGALYMDKTAAKDKKDDGVEPGDTYTYIWEAKYNHGPTHGDSKCLTWTYHSHVESTWDTNSGLVGPLVICRDGALDSEGGRAEVNREITALFTIFDENKSWYLDDNIKEYCEDPSSVDKNDKEFIESNKMHSVNGYVYGNVPGLEMCQNHSVDWHMFGMGGEVDIHTAYFHGQTFTIDDHRGDVATLLPAHFLTVHMIPQNPGTWLLNCMVDHHYAAGMFAMFKVDACKKSRVHPATGGRLREYFIAAEEVLWDYGPSGQDKYFGGSLTDPKSNAAAFFIKGKHTIGGVYKKALYFEYTDATFSIKKPRTPHQQHLGILGPVIRAEVGDQIRVVFRNMAKLHNFSIQPHIVFYNKSSEGALYKDFTYDYEQKDDYVQPGKSYVYEWSVPEFVGPTDNDTECITSYYSSAVNPIEDQQSGLIGPLLVCKRNTLDEKGKQKNVDKEFILLFMLFNENVAWYIKDNIKLFCTDPGGYTADFYDRSNWMHAINGRMYGNLDGLSMCKGDTVSWHLLVMGNEVDVHAIYFSGQTFILNSQRKDVAVLMPGTVASVIMKPDNVGQWAVVCLTNYHYSGGMTAKFDVLQCPGKSLPPFAFTGSMRTFFIAALEMEWDYAPSGLDLIKNVSLSDPKSDGYPYAFQGDNRIGKTYKKVLYRAFTDGLFQEQKFHPKYLGILGPIIRAEVGDIIKVLFKNQAKSRSFSIHPHGVLYNKKNEGILYDDGTKILDKLDDAVPAGESYVYTWQVPERSGPSSTDMNCITWAYYSAVDPFKDTSSGLIGPLVICRKGTLDENGQRKDVQREYPVLFTVTDESKSWYFDENIEKYSRNPKSVDKKDKDFILSNKMNGVNGLIYGNLRGLTMHVGDKVNWYLMAIGASIDLHTAHFHGQTFLQRRRTVHREDVLELFPAFFETVEMEADSIGNWMLHCHVNDHLDAGMDTTFEVLPAQENPVNKSMEESGTM